MVTFDQAFVNTKQDTRLSIKTKLQARGYDLEGELDDSFMGLQEEDLKAAKLTPPETTALRYVLAKITGRSGHEAPPGLTPASLEQTLRKVLDEVLPRQETKPKGFSSVGATEAESILDELQLQPLSGNILDPIVVPQSDPGCIDFDFAQFGSEDLGIQSFIKYHEDQLSQRGLKFGQGGFAIYDTHSIQLLYSIRTPSGSAYRGNVDAVMAPFGMMREGAAREARLIFEHKQNEEQKAEYRRRQGLPPLDTAPTEGPVTYAAERKGQAVTAMLAAYAYNTYPLLYDLTDGQVHHLLRVQGSDLYVWEDLKPKQAYYKLAKELLAVPAYSRRLDEMKEGAELEELLTKAPNKRLCTALRGNVGTLRDQLDAVVPFLPEDERLAATYEMMQAWSMSGDPAHLPFRSPEARMMFA